MISRSCAIDAFQPNSAVTARPARARSAGTLDGSGNFEKRSRASIIASAGMPAAAAFQSESGVSR